MKTHTIRNNKTKTARILTFTPAFETQLVAAHPWAARTLIAALLKFTGTVLDSESSTRLMHGLADIPPTSLMQHRTLGWLQSGFRLLDMPDAQEALAALDFAAGAIFKASEAKSEGAASLVARDEPDIG